MGDLKQVDMDFRRLWNGERYRDERGKLTIVRPESDTFEPCGECTRHCQHNRLLSNVEKLHLERTEEVRIALESTHEGGEPIWF